MNNFKFSCKIVYAGKKNIAINDTYILDILGMHTGPRLNIKTVLSTYGDFHVKDKTAVRTSYL